MSSMIPPSVTSALQFLSDENMERVRRLFGVTNLQILQAGLCNPKAVMAAYMEADSTQRYSETFRRVSENLKEAVQCGQQVGRNIMELLDEQLQEAADWNLGGTVVLIVLFVGRRSGRLTDRVRATVEELEMTHCPLPANKTKQTGSHVNTNKESEFDAGGDGPRFAGIKKSQGAFKQKLRRLPVELEDQDLQQLKPAEELKHDQELEDQEPGIPVYSRLRRDQKQNSQSSVVYFSGEGWTAEGADPPRFATFSPRLSKRLSQLLRLPEGEEVVLPFYRQELLPLMTPEPISLDEELREVEELNAQKMELELEEESSLRLRALTLEPQPEQNN